MKKLGLLWATIILVLLIGIFVIIPNYKELAEDNSILIYFAVVALVGAAAFITSTRTTDE